MSILKNRREREALSVAEQAAEWLLILEEADASNREAFADWLAQSPLHVGAFLRASALDSLLGVTDKERSIEIQTGPFFDEPPDINSRKIERLHGGPRWRLKRWQWATAACLALTAVALGVLALVHSGVGGLWGHSWKQYVTAVGEQRTVPLEDGSVLYLNTGSRVAVSFVGDERRVRLTTGEAMFRVAHDAARPFRVRSGDSMIQAIGTQFNVRRRETDSVVSVLEGVVQVSRERTLAEKLVSPMEDSADAAGDTVRLKAGEETWIAKDGSIAAPKATDVVRVSAWRTRRLVFLNEPLSSIAAEFNRYNTRPRIEVVGEETGRRRYAAAFDADDPRSLTVVLKKDSTLEIEENADVIVVRGK